jgi:hypothetical protein
MRTSLAALCVTGLLCAAVAGCGGGSDSSSAYPAAAKNNFITACNTSSGGNKTFCNCAFDRIEASMSYAEFKKEDAAINKGRTPSKKISDALTKCQKK